jgi:uncharacterized protein YcsI (UPF0317 family)
MSPESDPVRTRLRFRAGDAPSSTVGYAQGRVQANLAVLPEAWSEPFLAWCRANPAPCPVLGVSAPGDPHIPALGIDLDIRTDLPRYQVWQDGEIVAEPTDLMAAWQPDWVAIALGCSYSFDDALAAAGIPLRHLALGVNPPIYKTNIPTVPHGPFCGPVIVSMRPLRPADAIRAALVTARYPHAHGAPIHLADPAAIGVDLDRPFGGTILPLALGEIPVFWACGVTPSAALRQARPPVCATHWPGAMLVTDLVNRDLALTSYPE